MRAATKAPGTVAIDMADDQVRECTSEKPCATRRVGTHAVKPKKPRVWHIHAIANTNVRRRYRGATTSLYPLRRNGSGIESGTGGRFPIFDLTRDSIRSNTASASAKRCRLSYQRGDSSKR